MPTPFTLAATLGLPGTPGLASSALPFLFSGDYENKADFEYKWTGSGSQAVNLGSLPAAGAKGMLIYYEPSSSSAPVALSFNSSATPIELSAGGFIAMASPVPVAGITALTITRTTSGRLRIWLLG